MGSGGNVLHIAGSCNPRWQQSPSNRPLSSHDAASFPSALTQVGKAVGSEGLVAGQVVDIKSEGAGTTVGIETLQVRRGQLCAGKRPGCGQQAVHALHSRRASGPHAALLLTPDLTLTSPSLPSLPSVHP